MHAKLDPYEILGVPHSCRDRRLLKKAYKSKRKQVRDEKGLVALRSCYVYLKTFAEELDNVYSSHVTYSESTEDYAFPITPASSCQKPEFNFQLTQDNSVLNDGFDAENVLEKMLKDRPSSLSYQAILSSFEQPHYASISENDNSPAGFHGFDELDGAAPILTDGNYMFVEGARCDEPASHYSTLDETCGYREAEQTVHRGKGKLTKEQIARYLKDRDAAVAGTIPGRVSETQFQTRMRELDEAGKQTVEKERRQKERRVRFELGKLSKHTRENLDAFDVQRV